jgi:hypothetical protein
MFTSFLSAVPDRMPVEKDDDGDCIIVVPIASCALTDRIVSVDCRLAAGCGDDPGMHEFSFEISVATLDSSGEAFSTQDRDIAKPYIPPDSRALVLQIVCEACRTLLAEVRPLRVYRVTKGRNPPPPALRKHHLITQTMESCGYSVTDHGTEPFGRVFWVLDLIAVG